MDSVRLDESGSARGCSLPRCAVTWERKVCVRAIICIACIVGLSGSWGHAGAEPLLEGRVWLDSGAPVPGARVLLFDLTDLRAAPFAETTDRSGQFHPAPGHPYGGPARSVRIGSELPQPVQSFDDDSLPVADGDVRAAGGVQHPGAAGGHPGGRRTAGPVFTRPAGTPPIRPGTAVAAPGSTSTVSAAPGCRPPVRCC